MDSLIADIIVFVHLIYILFVVGGEVLILIGAWRKWRWIRNLIFRIAHLLSISFVAFESIIGMICPLTEWEYDFRERAGQLAERDISFVGRIVRELVFYDLDPQVFTYIYIGFTVVVIVTMILIPPFRMVKRK